MSVNILETDFWALSLPSEWWAESDEDGIVIGDRDGVGNLLISTLLPEEGEVGLTLEQWLEQLAPEDLNPQSAKLGAFTGFYWTYAEEGESLREWLVAAGPLVLLVSYSCDEDNAGMDDSVVDEFLATLVADPDISGMEL